MYISKSKIAGIIISIILVWLVIMNFAWYMWQNGKYSKYIMKGREINESTWLVPRYSYQDLEGFQFGVKYPEYMSLVGNLSVTSPQENEKDIYVDSLIIWPEFNGTYTYVAVIYDKKDDGTYESRQINIDADGKVLKGKDEILVGDHRSNINKLIKKAHEYWTNLKKE